MVDIAAARAEAATVRRADRRRHLGDGQSAGARPSSTTPSSPGCCTTTLAACASCDGASICSFAASGWPRSRPTRPRAGAGAAVWEPPGAWKHGIVEQLRLLPALLAIFSRHSPRVLRALAVLESGHPAEPEHQPHYYLAFLGVGPRLAGARAGRGADGAGARTLRSRARAGLPRGLDGPQSRALRTTRIRRQRRSSCSRRGAPPQWRMWREPG